MNEARTTRYDRARQTLRAAISPEMPWDARIAVLVDALWAEFGDHRPASWIGFYYLGTDEMTLGPRRDKPACSPIGLHGVCGQAARSGQSLLVPDVRALGANYIPCDPRDLAELVVPVRDQLGNVVGVLDLDSYAVSAFAEVDRVAIEELVQEFLR
jgi:putative methionine-R-sulfoxide reductase with GAF domain